MTTEYRIALPVFDGPFDLLLHLLERNELDITAISLAQVTTQYLAQVAELKEGPRLEGLIDFIVIGARLVLIKSRALLPHDPDILPDDEAEEDPAAALARQLRAYKRFKEAASWFHDREARGMRTYLRVAPPPKIEGKLDLSGITIATLQEAVMAVLTRVESTQASVGLVERRRITMEGQIALLRSSVQARALIPFHELLTPTANKVEVCITLLAILELMKRRELQAHQTELFGPILITAPGTAAPDGPISA